MSMAGEFNDLRRVSVSLKRLKRFPQKHEVLHYDCFHQPAAVGVCVVLSCFFWVTQSLHNNNNDNNEIILVCVSGDSRSVEYHGGDDQKN